MDLDPTSVGHLPPLFQAVKVLQDRVVQLSHPLDVSNKSLTTQSSPLKWHRGQAISHFETRNGTTSKKPGASYSVCRLPPELILLLLDHLAPKNVAGGFLSSRERDIKAVKSMRQ
jgi:hypothetical protein